MELPSVGELLPRNADSKSPSQVTSPPAGVTSIKEKEEIDGKLVAVISAAVASYLEKPKSKFKILSIKKHQTSSIAPWSAMGRQELMSGRK